MKKIHLKMFSGERKRAPQPQKVPFDQLSGKQKAIRICNLLSLPLQMLGCCLIYLIIEMISRHSFTEAWEFMTEKPLVFLYNAFLIFTTTTIVWLFRRRVFVRTLLAAFWLALGCINGGLLAVRVTPFTGPDLKLVADAFNTMNKYMSVPIMILTCIAIVLVIAGLVVLLIKAPKYQGRMHYPLAAGFVVVTVIAFSGTTKLALENRVISNYFGNVAFAYEDYGYPYGLLTTIFNTGISCPNGYSEELMDEIVASEGEPQETSADQDVNILFLQLESFFDPTLVEFLNLSEDPIPNFRQMMKEYSSGYYRVPSVGAGTANTEFETITGMSMHYFGPGEYPYKSILQETTCESIPYVLKELGYSTHAVHNNEANFYSRKSVFAKLGFDTFTSEEYMKDISDVTPTGWVKDHILTDEIIDCLNSSDGPDYVYTISVQGHGEYYPEPVLEDPEITVTGAENREKNNYSWEYYVNMIHEMDEFVKELTDRLEEYPEPVVLVMYGDHLPTMGLEVEDLKNKYLFQTQYVIWDNFGLEKQDANLAAYQIGAEVLDRLDIHEGTMVRYHQTRKNTKNYQVDLEALQYDILYGEKYVYGGENPFKKTDMKLGVKDITLDRYEEAADGTWYFYGENFTASSRVEVNGEMLDTIMVNNSMLMVQGLELEDGDEIAVAQQSNSPTKKVLSRTDKVIYDAPDEPEVPEPAGSEGLDNSVPAAGGDTPLTGSAE